MPNTSVRTVTDGRWQAADVQYPQRDENEAIFKPQRPAKSPVLSVEIRVITEAHEELGSKLSNVTIRHQTREALADTGCQTCTAGTDVLTALKCPRDYLISTKHRINAITCTSLDVIGAVMLEIAYKG